MGLLVLTLLSAALMGLELAAGLVNNIRDDGIIVDFNETRDTWIQDGGSRIENG